MQEDQLCAPSTDDSECWAREHVSWTSNNGLFKIQINDSGRLLIWREQRTFPVERHSYRGGGILVISLTSCVPWRNRNWS
ncbi:hypothetical protein TNCV_2311421 [Trichonephila clavipes]|nr:hypothetical protein TNCV_2311421 [Trichonephila clavipes]